LTAHQFVRPRRHLVTDEEIRIRFRGNNLPYRLRIWMGKECAPVILASLSSANTDNLDPAFFSTRIAKLAYEGYLRCEAPRGFLYWESYAMGGYPVRLKIVHFDMIGRSDRLLFIRPLHQDKMWGDLVDLVGQLIEH